MVPFAGRETSYNEILLRHRLDLQPVGTSFRFVGARRPLRHNPFQPLFACRVAQRHPIHKVLRYPRKLARAHPSAQQPLAIHKGSPAQIESVEIQEIEREISNGIGLGQSADALRSRSDSRLDLSEARNSIRIESND